MAHKSFKAWAMASTLLTGVGAAPALAQEAAQQASPGDDVITVTGSRIAREDFVSNSPVSTIDAESFELTNTVNAEDLLNDLPQTVPGLDRTSNNPGNGTATVNLRGLGANRTLVLVDGIRMIATDNGGVVDINNIPTALIERVEVVTGGASAVYGSDAIAGVVNFILDDDFEGLEIGFGGEMTEQGDAEQVQADITFGANFDSGRGNVVMNYSWTDREDLFQGDREFAQNALIDSGGQLIPGGSSGVPGTRVFFPFDFGGGVVATGTFNPDGTIRPFDTSGADNDFYNYAPPNYLQLPQERHQVTALGRYEINEHVEVYGRALFSHNKVPQQLAPTPAFGSFDINVDNPFLAPSAQAIFAQADTDSDGIATVFLGRRMLEVGPRISDDNLEAYQFQVGARGDLAGTWNYDFYIADGRSLRSTTLRGDVSAERFQQGLLATTDGSGNIVCIDPSGGCAPVNIFGEGNISAEAADFVRTRIASVLESNQFIAELNFAGDTSGFLELPGGPIGLAFGGGYREEDSRFDPSQNLADGSLLGFNGAPPVQGAYDVYDIYGEFYAPILQGAEFADVLAIEGAYRYSDYSTVGGVTAWKLAGEWAPHEDIRFRTSFNTATRAPNISELFSPQSNGFPGASDPCSTGFGSYDGTQDAICQATGVPAANVGTNLQPNSQIEGLFGGNPNLSEETAETFTVGVVVQPSAIPGFSFSVDYFDIEIEDVISTFGGGVNSILNLCYNVVQDPNSAYCQAVNRTASGRIDTVEATLQNIAVSNASGVDLFAEYSRDLDLFGLGGDMGLTFLGTWYEENSFLPGPGLGLIKCAGKFGNTCGEPNPEWQHLATLSYRTDRWTARAEWEYIGSTTDDNDGTTFAREEFDAESYFNVSGSFNVNETVTLNAGIDNLFDKEPPLAGNNSEQANTYPATYDVFGRTYWLTVRSRF